MKKYFTFVSHTIAGCVMSRISVLLMLACIFALPVAAQPSLEIKNVEVSYPKVRVYFKVTCNGVNRNTFNRQHFELYENGKLVKDAVLHCYEEPTCCMSTALVLDRSGSMVGPSFTNLQVGASAFVNEMNPNGFACDETAIVSFGRDVRLDVPLTSNKVALLAGLTVSSLPVERRCGTV
jgi:hypothetical protein